MNPIGNATDRPANPFAKIKVRSLFWVCFASILLSGFLDFVLRSTFLEGSAHIFFMIAFYILSTGIAIHMLIDRGIKISSIVGRPPKRAQTQRALLLVIPLVFLSLVSAYALYLFLSYLTPDFALFLLNEFEQDFVSRDYPLFSNFVAFCTLVLVGPICEEFLFRGVILHRWALKWGLGKAMVISSFVFGILHVDILGAFVFGYVMCILYVQSQSLWLPSIVHIANNSIAFIADLIGESIGGAEPSTLHELQSDWWIVCIGLFFAIWWGYRYLKNNWPQPSWHLPYYREVNNNS